MRHNLIRVILIALWLSGAAEAVIILPMGKPKPPPDPSKMVIDLGEIRLNSQEEAEFVCPGDPTWPCIGSIELTGQLPNWSLAGASVWFEYPDALGQTVTAGKQGVVARDFDYQQQVPSWATDVVLCIQNLADRQVVITNASLTVTYAPDPATLALVAIGTAILLVRRKF